MQHLQPFQPRPVKPLSVARAGGWHLKRYAILADGREFDDQITSSALTEALVRLPKAGEISDEIGNHGIGFQIVHFAEVAVVSPVFYWQWGSVLANIEQMRASWDQPTVFGDGKKEVVGCIWEMGVVNFEVAAWQATMLGGAGSPVERLARYLDQPFSA